MQSIPCGSLLIAAKLKTRCKIMYGRVVYYDTVNKFLIHRFVVGLQVSGPPRTVGSWSPMTKLCMRDLSLISWRTTREYINLLHLLQFGRYDQGTTRYISRFSVYILTIPLFYRGVCLVVCIEVVWKALMSGERKRKGFRKTHLYPNLLIFWKYISFLIWFFISIYRKGDQAIPLCISHAKTVTRKWSNFCWTIATNWMLKRAHTVY